MARKPRLDFPDLLCHITARGNNRQNIFFDEEDYTSFKKCLIQTKQKHPFLLYAFCLMPNHTHLLLKTTKDSRLAKIMQTLHTSYTMYFNRKYSRCGHLFQGRYKSILVEEESHLLELVRYIHQNPLRAGLVKQIADYSYSSYRSYLQSDRDDLMDKEEVLFLFAKRKDVQTRRFQAFVEEVKERNTYRPRDLIRDQVFLGSEEFENKVLKMQVNRGEEV